MRQIYTSQRLQNIDLVVAMMAEAGIATSVTNRRVYGGHDYKGPSYSARIDPATWPQVWVVRSADQPRARALLREAGIEPPTRYADELAQSREQSPEQKRIKFTWHMRTVLLGLIALIILLNWIGVLHFF